MILVTSCFARTNAWSDSSDACVTGYGQECKSDGHYAAAAVDGALVQFLPAQGVRALRLSWLDARNLVIAGVWSDS